MDLRGLVNIAFVFFTEAMEPGKRSDWDRRLNGFTGPTPQRTAEASRDLMAAMGLATR